MESQTRPNLHNKLTSIFNLSNILYCPNFSTSFSNFPFLPPSLPLSLSQLYPFWQGVLNSPTVTDGFFIFPDEHHHDHTLLRQVIILAKPETKQAHKTQIMFQYVPIEARIELFAIMAWVQVSCTETWWLRATQSFPIARRETFDVHQILLKLKFICLPFLLSLISTNHFRLVVFLTSRHDNGVGGVFWGVCFQTLTAVVVLLRNPTGRPNYRES